MVLLEARHYCFAWEPEAFARYCPGDVAGEHRSAQRAVEANNRRDYEALLDEFDPNVEWHGIFGVMFGGEATVVRGHEGLLGYIQDLDEGFSVRDVQLSEFRDLGDRIVALGHVRGRGRESGIEFDSPYGGLADFRNGKCNRYRDYLDHRQALEAAGLSE